MDESALEIVAQALVSPGKGILAADSTKGIIKRFAAVGLNFTPETNRRYKEMLFTSPGMEAYISGVILNDNDLRLNVFSNPTVIKGIKVDGGTQAFRNGKEEITQGLEGLASRLQEYLKGGAKFTKWRGVFQISATTPSADFINQNLERMTQFAVISQEAGLVPIVEPEILLDGDHTTTRCEEIETAVLRDLFAKLAESRVFLPGLLLKTSMVLPGKDSGVKAAPLEVAQVTLRTLKNTVPEKVGGIVFLSGGQSEEEATANLKEIGKFSQNFPWPLSFSFERALQNSALKIWVGKEENVKRAQAAFLARAKANSEARDGR
jgi:fructose-bisphosphate aldolase class I